MKFYKLSVKITWKEISTHRETGDGSRLPISPGSHPCMHRHHLKVENSCSPYMRFINEEILPV